MFRQVLHWFFCEDRILLNGFKVYSFLLVADGPLNSVPFCSIFCLIVPLWIVLPSSDSEDLRNQRRHFSWCSVVYTMHLRNFYWLHVSIHWNNFDNGNNKLGSGLRSVLPCHLYSSQHLKAHLHQIWTRAVQLIKFDSHAHLVSKAGSMIGTKSPSPVFKLSGS